MFYVNWMPKTMNFQNILKIIFLLLIVENGFFYIAVFMQGSNDTIFHTLMYFDVLCYLLLGVFLILQGIISHINEFTLSGVSFLIWTILTIIWRLISNFYSDIIQTNNTNNTTSETINTVYAYYVVAGIAFAIGIYFLSKSIQIEQRDMILINLYGIVNLISVILTIQIIGLIPKLLLVPLLGIIAYAILAKRITTKQLSY